MVVFTWEALVLGWLWGSFLNTIISRSQPRRASHLPTEVPPPKVTLLYPRRSFCFSCTTPIPWYYNLPVFSWLMLRGRCPYCHAPIGKRTLLIEVLTPALFGWVHVGLGTSWLALCTYALVSWALVAAGIVLEDRKGSPWMILLGMLLVGTIRVLLIDHWGK